MAPLYASKHFKINIQVSSVLKWNFSLCHQFFLVFPEIRDGPHCSYVYMGICVLSRFPPCPSKAVFVAYKAFSRLTLP